MGLPLPGKLKCGDLHGDAPESELEGVAGCFEPLAGEPWAGDPYEPLGLTPNILATHSMSESESRNLGDRQFAKVANVWPLLDWDGS